MTEPAPAVGLTGGADPLAPYDAVLVLSYGGPADRHGVPRKIEDAFQGRNRIVFRPGPEERSIVRFGDRGQRDRRLERNADPRAAIAAAHAEKTGSIRKRLARNRPVFTAQLRYRRRTVGNRRAIERKVAVLRPLFEEQRQIRLDPVQIDVVGA